MSFCICGGTPCIIEGSPPVFANLGMVAGGALMTRMERLDQHMARLSVTSRVVTHGVELLSTTRGGLHRTIPKC